MASGRVYRSDPFRPVLPNVGQYGVNLDSNSSESDTNSEAGKKPSSSSSSSSDEAMDTLTPYPPRHQPKGGVRKKSEEEYVPTQSGEEEEAVQEGKDSSASESSSPSSDSGGSLQRQVSRPRIQRRTQVLDEEEDEEDSTLTTWPRHTRVREGFGDFQPCPPRRRAARTLNYSKFYQSEEESSEEGRPKVVRRGRRRRRSDSEFEVSISEQSESEPSSADEGDTSEEEYLPRGGQRTRGTGRGKVSWWLLTMLSNLDHPFPARDGTLGVTVTICRVEGQGRGGREGRKELGRGGSLAIVFHCVGIVTLSPPSLQ